MLQQNPQGKHLLFTSSVTNSDGEIVEHSFVRDVQRTQKVCFSKHWSTTNIFFDNQERWQEIDKNLTFNNKNPKQKDSVFVKKKKIFTASMSRDHDKFYYDYENKTKLFSRYLKNFKKVADQIHLGLYFWKTKVLA